MVQRQFTWKYNGTAVTALTWDMFKELLYVLWGDAIDLPLNVDGAIFADWWNNNAVKYTPASLKDLEGGFKADDTAKVVVSTKYLGFNKPKDDIFLLYFLDSRDVFFEIESRDEDTVKTVREAVQKRFPHPAQPLESTSKDPYVHRSRIEELRSVGNTKFDLSRLVRYCEELNIAFENDCYFTVLMLVRAIIDHVPPIFGESRFKDVVSQHGTQSFKDSMRNLEITSRKIADSYLHTHIRKKESLPNANQVKFIQELDVLLSEVWRLLK